jgi:hypothetical protein
VAQVKPVGSLPIVFNPPALAVIADTIKICLANPIFLVLPGLNDTILPPALVMDQITNIKLPFHKHSFVLSISPHGHGVVISGV